EEVVLGQLDAVVVRVGVPARLLVAPTEGADAGVARDRFAAVGAFVSHGDDDTARGRRGEERIGKSLEALASRRSRGSRGPAQPFVARASARSEVGGARRARAKRAAAGEFRGAGPRPPTVRTSRWG